MSLKKSASISRLEQLARATAAQDPSSGSFETIKGSTRAATANAANATAAAVTISYAAAGGGVSHVLTGLALSYTGGTVTGGNVKIKDGATNVVFDLDINGASQEKIVFDPPLKLSPNTATNIVLASGGAGITGKLNVLGHYTEA